MTRQPYVDDENLAEAYRRSAQIDREEMDTLDVNDPRYSELLDSAEEFDELAEQADREPDRYR